MDLNTRKTFTYLPSLSSKNGQDSLIPPIKARKIYTNNIMSTNSYGAPEYA